MDKQNFIDDLFAQAKNEQVQYGFADTKTAFLQNVATLAPGTAPKKWTLLKKGGIMLAAISGMVIATVLLLPSTNTTPNRLEKTAKTPMMMNDSTESQPDGRTITKQSGIEPTVLENVFPLEQAVEEIATVTRWTEPRQSIGQPLPNDASKVGDDEPYRFPVLTEKEINATIKQKKAMLKALQKYDKESYAYIPSGTFDYNGKTVSIQAYYMSKAEVTNLEYRTFLFDLLIQDRKEEFLKAKPDQSQWTKAFAGGMQAMEEAYFSHPAYDDYPVVNVSKEGAEMYCKWLSVELRKFVGEKKEGNYNDIRLPYRSEWCNAASSGGKQLPYPWDGEFMRNSKGLYQANFSREESDTTSNEYVSQDITAPVPSYWPNNYGLYNMAGNVAEMVMDDSKQGVVGTAGGAWSSDAEGVKIYAPDPNPNFSSGKVDVGFRIVSTFLK